MATQNPSSIGKTSIETNFHNVKNIRFYTQAQFATHPIIKAFMNGQQEENG